MADVQQILKGMVRGSGTQHTATQSTQEGSRTTTQTTQRPARNTTATQGARTIADVATGGGGTTASTQLQTEDAGFHVSFSLKIRGGLHAGSAAPQDL